MCRDNKWQHMLHIHKVIFQIAEKMKFMLRKTFSTGIQITLSCLKITPSFLCA